MSLQDALRAHVPSDEAEAAHLRGILEFLSRHADPFDRRITEGHFTASALVLARSGGAVLLLHHRKLERWLQPGGHGEAGENSGEAVALREAREETGILDLQLHPRARRPLDVDIHAIPARPGEPAHSHLDLRYLVLAPDGAEVTRQEDESNDLRWFPWDALPGLGLDEGLWRALTKARRLGAS
jgi:8-oxo-dGTP pyrophosphatase MutT (NUDIX family)